MSVITWLVLMLIALLFGASGFSSEPVVVTVPEPDPTAVTMEPAPGWEPVTIADIQGVIIPAAAEIDFYSGFDEFWTPTLEDVTAAEAAILEDQGALDHDRQYSGVIDDDGDRLVLVNGFCDTMGTNWMAEPVFVLDGGDCFFAASFNVDTGDLERFWFNGDA
jgi:hypothetical protein